MSKFFIGFSNLVVIECRTSMFIRDTDIYRLMTLNQKIKAEKLIEREKEIISLEPNNLSTVSRSLEGEVILSFRDVCQHLHFPQPLSLHLQLRNSSRADTNFYI